MAFNLIPYVKDNTLRHVYYTKSVEHLNELSVHAYGTYPKKLIEERRPGESEKIHKFRKKIYQSKTLSPFNKVVSSLSKIRKAQDYVISFKAELPPSIPQSETPEKYLTKNFPRYTSLDNWFWSACFKQMLVDPNAVVLVIPTNTDKEDNQYYTPYPLIFNSDCVIDYSYHEWYLLKSKEQYYFTDNGRRYAGEVYYYVDKGIVIRYEQISINKTFRAAEFMHSLGYVPVVHIHGVVQEDSKSAVYYESRMASILPEFNEATREYSDMQAEVLQHIHSTMWAVEGKECKTCKGTGHKMTDSGAVACTKCNGQGAYPFDPYQYFSVRTPLPGENPTPTPPAGYLSKPIDIAQLQDKRIEDHIYYGLSAINYEFISRAPLSQSGIAKEFDKSETNNFVYSVAEDCVRIIDSLCGIVVDWRYMFLVPDEEEREELCPEIPVPQKFDVIPDSYLSDELKKLKESKVSPSIIAAAEVEYAAKKFYNDTEVRDKVLAEFALDPLSGNSEDDILTWLSNDGISRESFIIHCNIRSFIERAMNEDDQFIENSQAEQMEVMVKYAEEFEKDNEPVRVEIAPTADPNKLPMNGAAGDPDAS